jgi:hypothetical protein
MQMTFASRIDRIDKPDEVPSGAHTVDVIDNPQYFLCIPPCSQNYYFLQGFSFLNDDPLKAGRFVCD